MENQTTLKIQSQIEDTPPANQELPIQPVKNNKWLLTSLIFFSLVSVSLAGFFGYKYYQSPTKDVGLENETQKTTIINTEESNSGSSSLTELIPKEKKFELFYIKNPNLDKQGNLQAWMMNPDGTKSSQINLPNFSFAFKYPSSNEVFFKKHMLDDNAFFSKNIISQKITEYPLIDHIETQVNESPSIQNLNNIAPNGSFFIYNTMFTEPCPDFSLPPGFEGGFGPCQPEPNLNFPDGHYLYDVKNKTNTHLSNFFIISRWDLENNLLYFISAEYQNNGLYSLDLSNKKVSLIDKASTFGYGAFPFLNSDRIVKVEATTGDQDGEASMSKISLISLKTNESDVVDSGIWAQIQPFASIAPDEKSFLYLRSTNIGNGHVINSLHLYNVVTEKSSQITPLTDTESYSIHGVWIDNNTFITTLNNTRADENYSSAVNYLVSINTETKKVKRISDNDIYRFNNN